MTATERLRELLDVRGVEYVLDEEYGEKYPPEQRVTWSCDLAGEDMTVTARDYCIGINDDGSSDYCLDLEFHEVFTVEQAIAATLGSFNCTNGERTDRTCHMEPVKNYQVSEYATSWGCVCSNCGTFHEFTHGEGWKYCPICRAEVVDA